MARPVIIEGPDGGGKTHLAHAIEKKYGLEYRRPPETALSSSGGPGEGLVDWWDVQLALPDKALQGGVYDRCFYISDPIYQQAQPNRDLLVEGDQLASGIMRLWGVEPILIFCLPPLEVQLRNVHAAGRDRLQGVSDYGLTKVSNAYWACFAMWSNALYESVLQYDYTASGMWNHIQSRLAGFGLEEV